jgi:hypothetical protein
MKKEIPILFSTPMVQALLEGRKTMTRRIVKPQPDIRATEIVSSNAWPKQGDHVARFEMLSTPQCYEVTNILKCPYGKPGDIIWVRESCLFLQSHPSPGWIYKADDHSIAKDLKKEGYRWRPSIHMPKAAARIWLEVTDIKVERLHDITWRDIVSEGIVVPPIELLSPTHAELWERLWVSINGQESYEGNPWVWVVSFKVLSTTGKP